MKRLKILRGFGIFSVILLLGFFLPCKIEAIIGEGLKLVKGEPLNIKAESLAYLTDADLFVAEGSVEVTYRKSRLTAERVEFNQVTGDAIAIGDVVYEEEGETLVADRVELNFDSELGVVYVGEIALENDHYIAGQEIEKTGEETYLVRKGSYTACSSSRPAWQFRSSQAKVHQGEYLQAWNTVGYIKGIPVFYFPYFIFPIKTERQTGILVPEVGKSTSKGFTVTNAYFWAISDSQDATLSHTYYEERGHKIDLEYRYKYSKETDGTLKGEFARDKVEREERKRLTWNHRHGLPYSIKTRVNLNLTSDDRFDEDFETELDERTRQKLDSDVSFTRNFSRHSVRLSFSRSDDLRKEGADRADQRFPELHITTQKQQLFGSPLYIEQKTQISRLEREGRDEKEFERIDIHPTLSLPLNLLGQALTINPQLQLRETYYTRDATTAADPDLDPKPVHREYYRTSVSVNGPKLNRIFDLGTSWRIQKLKHLIEPNFSFYYAPGIDEDDLPKFDGIDNVGSDKRSRSIAYGITQRLLAKRVKESDWKKFLEDEEEMSIDELSTETKELASFSVTQSYNFEADEYPFSNINATLNTQPFNNYKLKLQTVYDIYVNTFVKTYINLNGTFRDFLNFGVTWNREATVKRDTNDITAIRQFLDLNTQFILFNRVGLTYRGRFNIEERERIEDRIGFTYNAQCWNIAGNYYQQLVSGEYDKGFRITIELKHIGELFDIKGLM